MKMMRAALIFFCIAIFIASNVCSTSLPRSSALNRLHPPKQQCIPRISRFHRVHRNTKVRCSGQDPAETPKDETSTSSPVPMHWLPPTAEDFDNNRANIQPKPAKPSPKKLKLFSPASIKGQQEIQTLLTNAAVTISKGKTMPNYVFYAKVGDKTITAMVVKTDDGILELRIHANASHFSKVNFEYIYDVRGNESKPRTNIVAVDSVPDLTRKTIDLNKEELFSLVMHIKSQLSFVLEMTQPEKIVTHVFDNLSESRFFAILCGAFIENLPQYGRRKNLLVFWRTKYENNPPSKILGGVPPVIDPYLYQMDDQCPMTTLKADVILLESVRTIKINSETNAIMGPSYYHPPRRTKALADKKSFVMKVINAVKAIWDCDLTLFEAVKRYDSIDILAAYSDQISLPHIFIDWEDRKALRTVDPKKKDS